MPCAVRGVIVFPESGADRWICPIHGRRFRSYRVNAPVMSSRVPASSPARTYPPTMAIVAP
jgi:hypothetical protein